MKKLLCILLTMALLAGCTAPAAPTTTPTVPQVEGEVLIRLSDEGIEFPADSGVHTANDIIYYEAGHDETYGEGESHEAHTGEEAAAHTVVHITQPGVYRVTGKLSAGQLAVDLGEDAREDPAAVVTLILDNAEITCRVAPAVIFYNVYECGDAENPRADVDTSAAGANVLLAEGSRNSITGSHVAKIYKPETVVDGDVENAKKLHKYDGALYSKMSMNVGGSGVLHIEADNEGLDSELHLTINGGEIYISSGNDGINTNEDGVSVTTINGGRLWIAVEGDEGDGIDSNGWLVINGGQVEAYACATSGDSGIDSDMGIQINGGTVIATGNMLDRIEDGGQTHLVFTFAQHQKAPYFTLKNMYASTVLEAQTPSAFTNLLFSSPDITEGTYTLWSGDTQYEGQTGMGGGFGFIGGEPIERPDFPGKGEGGDVEIPPQPTQPIVTHGTVQAPPEGDRPADMPVPQFPQGGEGQMSVPPELPEGMENMPMPELPEGVEPSQGGFGRQPVQIITSVLSTEFAVVQGANYFTNVRAVTE